MTDLIIDFTKEPLEKVKRLVSTLGGKTRIEILKYICSGKDWNVTKLARKLKCGLSNTAQQVNYLRRAGLIVKEPAKSVGSNIKILKPVYDNIIFKFGE